MRVIKGRLHTHNSPVSCSGFFITGTDTGIGKTLVSAGIMALARARDLKVAGMKPVASGAVFDGEHLVNDDAVLLQSLAEPKLCYSAVNPYVFEPPIAPHVAAARAEVEIDFDTIARHLEALKTHVDVVVVEGIGGWQVPLGQDKTVADLACKLDLPVILVVGLRLGCINHARLTYSSIKRSGCPFAGWIASLVDPEYSALDATLEHLTSAMHGPPVAVIPWCSDPTAELAAIYLEDVF